MVSRNLTKRRGKRDCIKKKIKKLDTATAWRHHGREEINCCDVGNGYEFAPRRSAAEIGGRARVHGG